MTPSVRCVPIAALALAAAVVFAPLEVSAQTCTAPGQASIVQALTRAKAAVPSSPKTADALQWAIDQVTLAKNKQPVGLDPDALQVFAELSSTLEWSLRLESTARLLETQAIELRRQAAVPPAPLGTDPAADELDLAAGHLRTAQGGRVLEVSGAPATLAIVLTNPATTRVRLSFDRLDGLDHVEVEWDPAIVEGLARRVTLAAARWSVSASIEPIFLQQGDGSIVIAARWSEFLSPSSPFTLSATYTALVADKGITSTTADQVAMTGWPQPTLTMTCLAAKSSIDAERFGRATTAGGDARAFGGVAPAIVTETLSILAEIAVERARSGAMQVLKQHFLDPVCSKTTGFKLDKLGLEPRDDRVLPRTCELLDSLRLEDALSSGEAVLRSLRDDLRLTVAPALLRKKLGRHAIAPLAEGLLDIVNGAIDRGSFAEADAQLALQLLVSPDVISQLVPADIGSKVEPLVKAVLDNVNHAAIKKALCGAEPDTTKCIAGPLKGKIPVRELIVALTPAGGLPALQDAIVDDLQARVAADPTSDVALAVSAACHARLAMAIVKRCSSGGCSVDQIGDLLKSPDQHFTPDTAFPAEVCWSNGKLLAPPASLVALQRLVIEGIELTAPVRTTTGRERAVAAIRLVRSVVARVNPELRDLELLSDLSIALVEERYDTALSVAVRMLERLDLSEDHQALVRDISKLGQLVGAVSAYVAVYRNTKELDPEAARKARKQALESLIDGATDRRGREGDGVLSIGSSVGVGYALSYRRGAGGTIEDDALGAPAIRVPLGVMYQRLPGVDNQHGWHLGIHLIDLGQFVTTGARGELEDPTWSSFIAPGVELGLDFRFSRTSTALFNVSVNATYAPGLLEHSTEQGEVSGAWRFGVALGYYVPFFDLN